MPNPAPAEAPPRAPAVIEAAIAVISRAFPLIAFAHRAALEELLRCVSASDPARPFRISVAALMLKLLRSRNTVSRYLSALVAAGLLERWQPLEGSRRWGFRCAWMRLTPAALEALGLQRAPFPVPDPNAVAQGKRFTRVRRIPIDLQPLLTRVSAERVVWLMSRARAAGQRVQTHLAGAMSAADPVGYVLAALRRPAGHARQTRPADTPGGHVGESYRYCGHVFAAQSAGVLSQSANRERAREIRAALRR